MKKERILVVCTTDSMIWNFLIPHIKKLQNDGYSVECACSITGSFFDDLRSEYGFVMHQVDFARSPYSFRNLRALSQLRKVIKERNISIVFCHETVGGALGRVVGHFAKCKVIYMAHGFHFYKGAPKSSRFYYFIEKFLSRYTDVLITINQEDYKVSKGFKAKETYLLPGIGVDTSKFICNHDHSYLRNELQIQDNELIVLSVGELIHRKNHETVIDAIKVLNNPHIHYVIAGEGELKRYLQNKVEKFGLHNVHLLGYRKDINKLCNSSDIFVMPSFQEGLSVALMEAMACGLPIIASNIRGNVDLISDDRFGILVEPESVNEYVNAISILAENRDLRIKIGKEDMNRVKEFDLAIVENLLAEIIEKSKK